MLSYLCRSTLVSFFCLNDCILDYKETIEQLLIRIESLEKTNQKLLKRVAELEDELEKYDGPKNSNNSIIPPSQYPNKKTRSLRKKSNEKLEVNSI